MKIRGMRWLAFGVALPMTVACVPRESRPGGIVFSVAAGATGLAGSGVAEAGVSAPSTLFRAEGEGSHASPGTNATAVLPGRIGLADGDELDGVSYGRAGPGRAEYHFSVSPASAGAAGSAVAAEAAAGEAPGDVFRSAADGRCALAHDEVALGLRAPTDGGAPDDLDALEMEGLSEGTRLYFSVGPGAAGLAGSAVATDPSPGAVFVTARDGTNRVFVSAADLGLAPGDDLDALFVHDDDGVFDRASDWVAFSVAPGASGTPGSALAASDAPAADLFRSAGDGTNDLLVSASDLGLLRTDDLDALDIVGEPDAWIPPDDEADVPADGRDDGTGDTDEGDDTDDATDADHVTTPFCGDGVVDRATLEECDPGDPAAGIPPAPCADAMKRCTSRCRCVDRCVKVPDPADDRLAFDPAGPTWGPTTEGSGATDLFSGGVCVDTEMVSLELIGYGPMPAAPMADSFFDVYFDFQPGGAPAAFPWRDADGLLTVFYEVGAGWSGAARFWDTATGGWVHDGSIAVDFAPPDGVLPMMTYTVPVGAGGLPAADLVGTMRFVIGQVRAAGGQVIDIVPAPDLPGLAIPEW